MHSKMPVAVGALFLTFALFAATRAVSQSNQAEPPAPSTQDAGTAQSGTAPSGYVLKVTTRLVTVDVIATDSHGNPVRDLKPEEVQVFEDKKAQQKIEHFEYFEKMKAAGNSGSGSRRTDGRLSNQLPLEQLKVPPTVLLIDSLNTQTANQQQSRAQMIQLLRTLPPDTPIAVFLLGGTLRILQGFTTDPALLRAALDQTVTGSKITKDPQLDTENTSSYIEDATAGVGKNMGLTAVLGEVQSFEKEDYAMSMDARAKGTLGAMAQIGQYLSGIPGRKNLIWVSESFPISVVPDPQTGNDPFGGIREYSEQVKAVANLLTDAQVAVYPMDVRGLQANQVLAASENVGRPPSRASGPSVAGLLQTEDNDRLQSQGTMAELAQDTGGKTCTNGNDISGCVMTALKDSSNYYELSFYPQNVNWDGKFHKIQVKTTRSGLKLSYRRGYYAMDASSLAKKLPPEEHLRQACADQLPSTTIPLTVQALPPGESPSAQTGLQYLLLISSAGLASAQEGGSYNFNVKVAECEFAQKDSVFRFHETDLPKAVSGEVYKSWQSAGIPYHMALAPPPETRRIRLAVLDVSSGLTGAIDIPVTAAEIAKASAPAAPPPPPVETPPYLELPDKVKGSSEPKVMASLTFHLGADSSGTLVWRGDALLYQTTGDMPLDKAAEGFSGYAFGGRFHCQDGHFAPVDVGDTDPAMRFSFHNHIGKAVVVDLKGDAPVYVGDLPVDPSAQAFFDQVWKVSHCQ